MLPKLTIESIKFNKGETIKVGDSSITIFVGGNNVGKSVALKNLYNLTHPGGHTVTYEVIVEAEVAKVGSAEDFITFIKSDDYKINLTDDNRIHIGNAVYHIETAGEAWLSKPGKDFGNIFIKLLLTENRLSFANDVDNKDFYREKPTHPIHFMYLDEAMERTISDYFRKAFSLDLVVDRFSGKKIHLKVGSRPKLNDNEHYLSRSYNERIRALPFLKHQGDGMRSFVSLLTEILSKGNNSLLIDEPEAFLHPPQARLLGKLIGTLFIDRQMFVATHSSDFIKGVLESKNTNINIIRIQRKDEFNIGSVLNNKEIETIWHDPILRHSSIIDGLFHENVIICESDGDCRFFSSLLQSEFENHPHYSRISDTLFVPAHGKAKMPYIVSSLKKLSVPTYSICDFDILNNSSPLKDLIHAHGGEWSSVESNWRIVYNEVNQIKSQLNKTEAKKQILDVFNEGSNDNLEPKQVEKLRDILRTSTAWSFVKKQGISFIPAGQAHSKCIELLKYLNGIGIFPLPVGELESFDKSIGGSKSNWLSEVLKKDFKNPQTLRSAKDFLHEVVKSIFESPCS